ncbi:MAG: carbon starvation protein A [Planctomycetota bacterium]|nr:carbon starvation protein A [Planctomycetota bacterium]
MTLPLLALGFLALLAAGYHFYGKFVARRLGLDDTRVTPAHRHEDGVDFVPTRPFYLFAQHFSAIAAAGPIAGPILACQQFGWLPCLLWIGFGVVFIGAVHDFSSLVASLRHEGSSIAEIARARLGTPAGRAFMAFIWIALIYVIVAFADITAGSFVSGTEELEGAGVAFNAGGAVAAASVLYLGLALVMGVVQRLFAPPLWLVTLIFVPATFALSWLGTELSTWLVFDARTWGLAILAYCLVASVTPVWALLQPRGYLGGFVLYSAIAIGVIGVLFGGYELEQPAVRSFDTGKAGGQMFPFLFVTIACGACSGFHGLVCSGTTSKQVERESHSHFVGYGAMLAEAFVALIALVTVAICTDAQLAGKKPGAIYGAGIGDFMTLLVGPENRRLAITFGAMAFSTFVFDTLDVATRLGRYLIQELTGLKGPVGAFLGTFATLAPAALFLAYGGEGAYLRFWALFGASNQLLAALTLIAIAVWLRKERRSYMFVVIPFVFLLVVTLWALVAQVQSSFAASQGWDVARANGIVALVLVVLALYLVGVGFNRLRSSEDVPQGERTS